MTKIPNPLLIELIQTWPALDSNMKEAIKKSRAKKVYIANVMTQVNQTHGFTLGDHVREIERYLGRNVLDFVVFNNRRPSKKILEKYEEEQSFFVENDLRENGKPKLVGANITEKPVFSKEKSTKQQLLRHCPEKLGRILVELAA